MATILVGENVPDLREVLTRLLHRNGHHVTTAGTADDTLTTAQATPFDLLLMNPALPGTDGLDGLQVCRRLRADPATAHLPIMMLSVRQYPAEVAAARAAGAERVVVAAYLLAPGHFHDKLQGAGADRVTAPLLPDERIAAVLLDRYDAVLG